MQRFSLSLFKKYSCSSTGKGGEELPRCCDWWLSWRGSDGGDGCVFFISFLANDTAGLAPPGEQKACCRIRSHSIQFRISRPRRTSWLDATQNQPGITNQCCQPTP